MTKTHTSLSLFVAMTVLLAAAPHADDVSLKKIYASGKVMFTPVMTLDESRLPEDVFFESITDIALDKAGNVYLCDFRGCNIKKFAPDGAFIGVIGEKGQGPGEFNMPMQIAVSGDRLIVYDMGNRRLCALTQDGEYIKNIVLQNTEGRPRHIRALHGGGLVIEREVIHYAEGDKPQDCIIQLFSSDLELENTIFTHQVMRNKFTRIQGMFSNVIQPFSPDVWWNLTPDGRIVVGLSEDYTIETHDPVEGKVSSFKHAYEPVRVTNEDKERFFSQLSYGSSDGGRMELPQEIKKLTDFPRNKPAFNGLLVDPEGNILVHTIRNTSPDSEPLFDAFDPEGNFIETVTLKGMKMFPREALVWNGYFWITQWDEEGQASVFKYRLVSAK
jgi:hypothetical protein